MRYLALILCLLASTAAARDIYVDPAAEAARADGSTARPFNDLHVAARSGAVQGGDRIILKPGRYGRIKVINARFEIPVQIMPEIPGTVHADQIVVQGGRGLYFHGLSVWPSKPNMGLSHLVHARADAIDIQFNAMDIRGSATAPDDYMSWTKQEWLSDWRANGVRLDGAYMQLAGSRVTGVAFGVTATGPHANINGNRIEGFSGDAMRGLGNRSMFAGNHVSNCFKVDKNHDDGFQSWAREPDENGRKTVSGIRVENNTILEWTGPANHPLRCTLQGIGLFDGHYRNFSIRNNLIAVSAWHGIAIYAGIDSRIINNTVVHISGGTADRPWIMLSDNRNGWESGAVEVSNNVAMRYRGIATPAKRNAVARYPAQFFRDPAGLDFRPKPGSPLVDAGRRKSAPKHDLAGTRRTGKPDLGAFELR